MQGMILHMGAQQQTREQLALLPVPAPMGPHHVVRPFIDDVNLVSDTILDLGLEIKAEGYGVANDEQGMPARFFGLMELVGTRDDFGVMVGLRGSYDQRIARGLAIGSNVFVCDNLAFSGEIEIKTKQTTYLNDRIPALLRDAVARIPEMAQLQERKFDNYRSSKVAKRVGDAMLVEMVRRKVLTPSQLGNALVEWDRPCHDEHAEDGYSLWRLHNAVTEALKPRDAARNQVANIWQRTTKMTEFLDEVAFNEYRVH